MLRSAQRAKARCREMGARKPGPQGDREAAVKTIARGRPGRPAEPVVPAACIFFCRRATGLSRGPVFPAPSRYRGQCRQHDPGRECAAGLRWVVWKHRGVDVGERWMHRARCSSRLRVGMALQQIQCRPGLEPGPITTGGHVRHASGSVRTQHVALWLWVPDLRARCALVRDDSGG
jgi:hypothetical protein